MQYARSTVESKTDTHDNHFLFIRLAKPSAHFAFDYNDTTLTFEEHHLSIYEHIDDEIGFNSLYHYTLRFKSHLVHVYFNENGEHISATIEDNKTQKVKTLHHFLNEADEECLSIKMLLEQQVQPIIHPLRAQHHNEIFRSESNYTEALKELKRQLFDESQEITKNLSLIQKNIRTGEKLFLISHKKSFVNKALRYLEHCKETLNKAQHEMTSPKSTKITAAVDQASKGSPSSASLPRSSKPAKKRSSNTTMPVKKIDNAEIDCFEEAYNTYATQWAAFEACTTLSEKIELFDRIEKAERLATLSATALVLELNLTNPRLPNEHTLLSRAVLDVNLYQQAYEKAGISLLLNCLSLPELLARHEKTLGKFALLLSSTVLEESVRRQDISAVTFLLKHSTFKINHLFVKKKGKSPLSLLCAAYHYKNIALFELLLENKASCMALYEDMPLAHTLLQLSVSDAFHKALLRGYQPVLDANPRFYLALCTAVSGKLRDTQLTQEQKSILDHALIKYNQISQANHGVSVQLPRSVRENIVSIREAMNPDVLQELSDELGHENEMQSLYTELNKKSIEFLQLTRKSHQSQAIERACIGHYKKAEQLIKDGFGSAYHQMSKEDVKSDIKNQIVLLTACINYYQLRHRPTLSKDERTTFQQAVITINENTKKEQQSEKGIAAYKSVRQLLDNIEKGTSLWPETSRATLDRHINNVTRSLNKVAFNLNPSSAGGGSTHEDEDFDGDDFKGVDFLATAEEREENVKQAATEDPYANIPPNPLGSVDNSDLDVPRLVRGIQFDLTLCNRLAHEARSLDPADKPRDVGAQKVNCQHALMDDEVFYEAHPLVRWVGSEHREEDLTTALTIYRGAFFGGKASTDQQAASPTSTAALG